MYTNIMPCSKIMSVIRREYHPLQLKREQPTQFECEPKQRPAALHPSPPLCVYALSLFFKEVLWQVTPQKHETPSEKTHSVI